MLEALILLNAVLVVLCTALYYRVRQVESAELASREASTEELQEALRVVRAARTELATLQQTRSDGAGTRPLSHLVEEPGWGRGRGPERGRAAL